MLGVTVPVGAGLIRASAVHQKIGGTDSSFNKFGIGYAYNLSKRTQVFGTIARVSNKGTSTRAISAEGLAAVAVRPGATSTGIEAGIKHMF
nr:porin [Variovorax paradoxus]